ncbi:MAG: tRNA uridine-5-carboxymethylaminomethyl(34) synthesis enzyme MnmG [Clostridiales bacterium]|nr:tRNA uridine-5-carboxymethylaminomethyl(34) synthesis enzyme MnmG [Clostridiales bacterium]
MVGTVIKEYDVCVIGGGHAGCEAALACARMGLSTAVFALNLDTIAFMACNPSIGGTSKGHLVREIDALGGEMGINADKASIQVRMLNVSKGPAVHSLRAQADKQLYQNSMKMTLECTDNLDIIQGDVIRIHEKNTRVCAVELADGEIFPCRAAIVASGVYLRSNVIMGEYSRESGPNGFQTSTGLSLSLEELGFELRRFKTGTPARINRRTIDFSKTEKQPGDTTLPPFSFMNSTVLQDQDDCYLTYTNEKTHEIIRNNIHRSPLYSGIIKGTGPRYCPSIEDKVMRFPERTAHQLFLEPEGRYTNEIYVQGMSSSLPVDVQREIYHSVKGLENAHIMRYAYAIEYDCIDPQTLTLSLQSKSVGGLFFAGQINGSSGYEEAAAQGIIAGINATLYVKGNEPFTIARDEGYIGVLIDDLVTKGTNEPYRMMTSRSEYRLLLRQDNADARLTEKGRSVGLVCNRRFDSYMKKYERINSEKNKLQSTVIHPTSTVQHFFIEKNMPVPRKAEPMSDLLKRDEIDLALLDEIGKCEYGDAYTPCKLTLPIERSTLETDIKYEGYIVRQKKQAQHYLQLEGTKIPEDISYDDIRNLRIEARQKLSKIRPVSIGQASRISGVSPADISVLTIYIEHQRRTKEETK